MGAREFVVRTVVVPTFVIVLGAVAVFGFNILEPMYGSIPQPPESLGWGDPGGLALEVVAAGMVGTIAVVIIWYIAAPIRADQRQQFR